jgi:chromate transporter
VVLLSLVASWLRIGTFAFGGGPGMIPLMKAECVDGQGWLTEEQFLDGLAASSALPGPISAKMSVYVGMEVAGFSGAAVAFVAVMVPGVALMSILASLLLRYRDNPSVSGAMAAVQPVVVGLLAWTVISLVPDGVRGIGPAVLAAGALAAMALKVHPAIVIVVAMGIGAVWMR